MACILARMLPGPWCRSPAKTVSSGRSCSGTGTTQAGGVTLGGVRLAFAEGVFAAAAGDGAVECKVLWNKPASSLLTKIAKE